MADSQKKLILVNALNIWEHQKDAVREIIEYIENFSQKAFLVKMPTGTGKTGVFATLSRVASPELNYIIITPSTALKSQIVDELKTAFWKKINKSLDELVYQTIESLLPSDADQIIESVRGKQFILVTTIQALQAIAANDKYHAAFAELQARTNCLIFDEGHKEPAYTWGETVRSFKKPTILFSATPYRNDYKIFNIDKEKFYSLEHSLCEKQNILRKIEIKSIVAKPLSASTFLNELLVQINALTSTLNKQGIKLPKVIIRCENSNDISKIVKALIKTKKSVLGIHDTFPINKIYTSEVPSKEEQSKYQFFVHQYKLIEGIDNPDFCIVALFTAFKNTRLLIQQVGRVLRNPNRKPNQIAYLFGHDAKKLQSEWDKYLEYDQLIDTRKKLFDVTDVLKVNKDASTLYFSGAFRELVNVNNLSLEKSLLFQKKINAFFKDPAYTFEELAYQLLEEWNKRDYFILKQERIEQNKLLILYIKYENSPLVKEGIFIEQKLALTFMRFDQEHVFYYDSEGNSPMYQIDQLTPVSRESLIKLFKNKRSINKIFLMNTDIGGQNVRNKELQAVSVENTAPGLADHSYFPARIEGIVNQAGEIKRRYIGFQNGRITDFSTGRIEFDEFQLWLDDVQKQLLQAVSSSGIHGFLNRFSQKADPPAQPVPISILLDLDNEILYQYTFGDEKAEVIFDDLCANINNNTFALKINNRDFSFGITYVPQYRKFTLTSVDLHDHVKNISSDEAEILNYLNATQSFRIVIEGNEYVYAYKNFFRPGLNLISKNKDLDLNQIFHPHACISKISSEKGSAQLKVANNLWHQDTLFGLIARSAKGYRDIKLQADCDFEHLLCDDLNGELGDFIALNTRTKQVIFIHAKAKKSKLSASAFQEICGQATKNLDYLTPYFDRHPTANVTKWSQPWSVKNFGVVNNRIITGGLTPKQFWAKYLTLMADPTTSREVWMFVGDMFDYPSFKREINKSDIKNVKAEVIQLVYLLRSTWNSVSSVGAQLKVYC